MGGEDILGVGAHLARVCLPAMGIGVSGERLDRLAVAEVVGEPRQDQALACWCVASLVDIGTAFGDHVVSLKKNMNHNRRP